MTTARYGIAFEPSFQLKRKRLQDDNDEFTNAHDFSSSKRRNITQLPIRSPPRPSISVTPAFGNFPLNPGTLTPDSIPEDDVFRNNVALDKAIMVSRAHSTDSLAVQPDINSHSNDDTEMELSSPKQADRQIPTPSRIGRARSNDLMSPVRSPVVIPPSPSRWAQDRIPTPVACRFPAHSPFESSFASAAARQIRSHLLPTSLSPMVDAESWTPQIQRPPSPDPETDLQPPFDGDAMMDMEESTSNSNMMSSSFSELSVHSSDTRSQSFVSSLNLNSHSSASHSRSSQTSWASQDASGQLHRGLGLDQSRENMKSDVHDEEQTTSTHNNDGRSSGYTHGHTRNQSSTGRTARLHMGFRADCEKCIARVPGHYSHILWS